MHPIYTAFYTAGTFYEQEADRLRRSLDRLSLDHDIRAIDPIGDWVANSRFTAQHIVNMLEAHPDRAIVQVDADAVVWGRPTLFDSMESDIAIHHRRGTEWLNGTVYFAPTPAARMVAGRYLELINANPNCANEQTMLGKAIGELSDQFKLFNLPASYCFIKDIMENDVGPGDFIYIQHMQASRQARNCGGQASASRARWIKEADHALSDEPQSA